ncbi:hypothetical protein Tco_0946259, partial [Tanacetum coccineum]
PIYVATGNSMRFCTAVRHKDFDIEDKDVEFREVIEVPLLKASLDTAFVGYGRGITLQLVIPENPTLYLKVSIA